MADNEKDVPVKELDDGSAVANVDLSDDIEVEIEESDAKEEAQDNRTDEERDDDEAAEEHSDDEDEREKIREARREERKLKKELAKQRDLTARNKISALEKRNEDLARRIAAMENVATSYQFAQIDKSIEDEATRIEYAKMKMLQAAQENDAAAQVEYLEQLTEAKQRLQQVQHYKKQQLEQAKAPKQNVPNEMAEEVQKKAQKWLKKNSWYDPHARDTDSRIAKVIDQELASDGWDPSDSEYWEELDNRLSARLPHRYTSKGGK